MNIALNRYEFAPKVTVLTLGDTFFPRTLRVENLKPIRVWGVVITQLSNFAATINIRDGTNIVWTPRVSAARSGFIELPIKQIYSNGFNILWVGSGSGARVKVYHSHPGT